MEKFKVTDRVRRLPFTVTLVKEGRDIGVDLDGDVETMTVSTRGCAGVVKALRHETSNSTAEARTRSVMIQVLWDNGTLSYHGPEALEHVE